MHELERDEREDCRPEERRATSFAARALRLAIPVAILGLGWLGFSLLSVESEKRAAGKPPRRAIKTRVVELRVEDFRTVVRARGTVRPHNEVALTPQVAGRIVRVLPGFEDGAFFSEGDVLVEIDPADFHTAVIVAEAQLARAKSVLAQEETRAKQARLNWEDLGYEEEPNELVLRLPQLREAKANVASAEAQLEQARRNLERAKVRAPFDGRVRARSAGVGLSVGPGTPLGTIFAIDWAEVRLPIPARDRKFLELPEDPDDQPIEVELRDALEESDETVWTARVIRTEGALDASTLDLYAIARVIDPFGRASGRAPLRVGQPVVATIPGEVLEDVVAVPRAAVRRLDRIFLVHPVELTIRALTISTLWSDDDTVVTRHPEIADGALLATTDLVYAPVGSKVEILPDPNAVDSANESGAPDAGGTPVRASAKETP